MKKGIESGRFSFGENIFRDDYIQTSINTINGLIVRGESVTVSPQKALETACRYERSLIETRFFEVISKDSEEITAVMEGRIGREIINID